MILPATLKPAPDRDWKVTSIKGHETSNGSAFVATVRLDGKIVGTFENSGRGGGTWLVPNDRSVRDAFAASAAAYAKTVGEAYPSEEMLADALVAEYDLSKAFTSTGRKNTLVLEAGETESDDPIIYKGAWAVPTGNVVSDRSSKRRLLWVQTQHPECRIWVGGTWVTIDKVIESFR